MIQAILEDEQALISALFKIDVVINSKTFRVQDTSFSGVYPDNVVDDRDTKNYANFGLESIVEIKKVFIELRARRQAQLDKVQGQIKVMEAAVSTNSGLLEDLLMVIDKHKGGENEKGN